jgi:hypothetical protein
VVAVHLLASKEATMGELKNSESAYNRTEIRRRELVHEDHILPAEDMKSILDPVQEHEIDFSSTRRVRAK